MECNLSFDVFSNHLTSSVTNRFSWTKMLRTTSQKGIADYKTTSSSRRPFQGLCRVKGGSRSNQTCQFPRHGRGYDSRRSTYNSINYNNTKVPETDCVDRKCFTLEGPIRDPSIVNWHPHKTQTLQRLWC